MKRVFPTLLVLLLSMIANAQNEKTELPYRVIPDYPEQYTAATVAARLIDGVGFRYYWATEGLRPEDLSFTPGTDARSSHETLIHIYELSLVIVNSIRGNPNEGASKAASLSFQELRQRTLDHLKETSDVLKAAPAQDLGNFSIVFKRGESLVEFPFWNQLNGPISDALWHIGQVVTFRRSSGNAFNPNVSVLQGTLRE